MYSHSEKKPEDVNGILASELPGHARDVAVSFIGLGREFVRTKADKDQAKLDNERSRDSNTALLNRAKLQYKTDKKSIRTNAELKREKLEYKREKNEKKFEIATADAETRRILVLGHLESLERKDEAGLLLAKADYIRAEKGLPSSGNYTSINSDAATVGMIGLLAAPQAHRQIAAAPQSPALEMPQATSSTNSNQSMVPRK